MLDTVSLQLLWYAQRQTLGFTGDSLLFECMDNSNYRYHAYRAYISFVHGYLGRRNRRIIPACVVSYIRTKWPDPEGTYVGYKDPDDESEDVYRFSDELAALHEEQ